MKKISFFSCLLLALQGKAQLQNDAIGVVLSGGAARGFAHLGVLQALEDNGIVPTYVSGASMGAVLGSVYAAGKTPYEIYNYARQQRYFMLYRPSFNGALFRPKLLENLIQDLIPHNNFDSLQKKMFVCVTNLNKAKFEIMSTGTIKDKVVASASIPGVFEPCIIDSNTYVDGGLTNNLPVEPLREQCKHVIGISVNSTPLRAQDELKGMDAIHRAITMVVVDTERPRRSQCDFFIEVTQAGTIGLLDFNRVEDFYTIGYNAAVDYIKQHPDILKLSNLPKTSTQKSK